MSLLLEPTTPIIPPLSGWPPCRLPWPNVHDVWRVLVHIPEPQFSTLLPIIKREGFKKSRRPPGRLSTSAYMYLPFHATLAHCCNIRTLRFERLATQLSPPMCPRLLAFLTGVLLLSITSAQARHFEDSYGDGAASGPWGVPVSTYRRLMSSPNATSAYTVPSPNTSAPYPASGPANGWSLAVSVIADIRMSESDSGSAQEYPNKTFTGSRVVLQAPAEPIHESW